LELKVFRENPIRRIEVYVAPDPVLLRAVELDVKN
jgi:hypothetical protein